MGQGLTVSVLGKEGKGGRYDVRVKLETTVAAKAKLEVEVHALLSGTPLLLLPCAVQAH